MEKAKVETKVVQSDTGKNPEEKDENIDQKENEKQEKEELKIRDVEADENMSGWLNKTT